MRTPSRDLRRAARWTWFLLALASVVGCAALARGPSGPSRPFFDAEVLTGVGDRGQSVATVSVSIPYRNLVFFREESGYVSSYRIRVVQADPRGARALKEWSGRVEVPDYESTRASSIARTTVSLDLTSLVSDRKKGDPRLEVIVEIDRTSRRAKRELPLRLDAIRPGSLTLGELALYRQRDAFAAMPAEVEVLGRALPDPELFRRQEDARFDIATGDPWLFLRVFDLRGGGAADGFEFQVRVEPAGGDSVRYQTTVPARRQGYVTSALLRLPASAFVYGSNQIEVRVEGAEPVHIDMTNAGLDLSDDASWRANLLPLEGIATEAEYAELRSARVAERDQRWWEFWDRLDPDPTTPDNERLLEHFRRVRYARQRLVDGFSDGARSDRGKVYIRLGPPDTIDQGNSRFDAFASYQVWRYSDERLVYYFQDSVGTGNYRLVWWEES